MLYTTCMRASARKFCVHSDFMTSTYRSVPTPRVPTLHVRRPRGIIGSRCQESEKQSASTRIKNSDMEFFLVFNQSRSRLRMAEQARSNGEEGPGEYFKKGDQEFKKYMAMKEGEWVEISREEAAIMDPSDVRVIPAVSPGFQHVPVSAIQMPCTRNFYTQGKKAIRSLRASSVRRPERSVVRQCGERFCKVIPALYQVDSVWEPSHN
jgi:hypothetical protein